VFGILEQHRICPHHFRTTAQKKISHGLSGPGQADHYDLPASQIACIIFLILRSQNADLGCLKYSRRKYKFAATSLPAPLGQ
jgi:hypothetical protein